MLVFLFSIFMILEIPTVSAASLNVNLTSDSITDRNYERDIDADRWDNGTSFTDTNGKSYTYGVGFNPYSYYAHRNLFVSYDISDHNKTTFEATVSLQKDLNKGDIGQTTIEVYADSTRLYKKVFVNSTKPEKLKLAIPSGTEKLKIYSTISDGANGIQYAFVGNPQLTNSLSKKASSNVISLYQDLNATEVNYDRDVHKGTWSSGSAFKLTDGTNASNAYGFEPYDYYDYKRMYAKFHVGDYNHSTLEATVSLDKNFATGDRGQSEFVIYADNKKIYSKTFKNNTPQQNIKLALPKGTNYLTFYALVNKGNQGNHAIILDDARLTNSLRALPKDNSISVTDLGTSSVSYDRDVFHKQWGSLAFQLSEGSLVPKGVGFSAYSYYNNKSIWSQYYIGDYSLPTLETKVSLDARWKTGDRGISNVYIYADDKVIYQTNMSNASKSKDIILSIPKGTQYLKFGSDNPNGNAGHAVIFEDPRLTTRPQQPTVSGKVYETSTVLSGKTTAKASVQVKVSSTVIGTATASSNGSYSIKIPKQKVGTQLNIYAVDSAQQSSLSTYVKVEKNPNNKSSSTPPSIKNMSATVSLKINALKEGDIVKVYNSKGEVISTTKPLAKGENSITVSIPKQLSTSEKVYITVTNKGAEESSKVGVTI